MILLNLLLTPIKFRSHLYYFSSLFIKYVTILLKKYQNILTQNYILFFVKGRFTLKKKTKKFFIKKIGENKFWSTHRHFYYFTFFAKKI